MVIKAVIGNGITGDAYILGSNEQLDGRRVDSLYLHTYAQNSSVF